MTDYLHATNLLAPFSGIDMGLLTILTDYRIGEPVPVARLLTAISLEELKAQGYVGLYLSREEFEHNADLRRRTGWTEKVLGEKIYP
jgi:hypothetical protein